MLTGSGAFIFEYKSWFCGKHKIFTIDDNWISFKPEETIIIPSTLTFRASPACQVRQDVLGSEYFNDMGIVT